MGNRRIGRGARGSHHPRAAATAIAAAVVFVVAPATLRATATWKGTNGTLWSNPANWAGQQPAAADVVFGIAGSSLSASVITNVDDVGEGSPPVRGIASLWYQHRSDLGQFHTTQINNNYTLRITGAMGGTGLNAGSALFVGTAADNGASATVSTIIKDAPGGGAGGTLFVDSPAADVTIAQTSDTVGGTKRATLDLSGLTAFRTNVRDLNIGVGAGSGSPNPAARADGTFLLAKNNTISADNILLSSNPSGRTGLVSQLWLGANNTFNVGSITVGGPKAPSGTLLAFKNTVANGTLTIAGAGGLGRADLAIGAMPAGGTTDSVTSGTFDLTSTSGGIGSISACIGELVIGRAAASGSNGNGSLTFDAGTIDANTVTLGDDNATTFNTSGNGILNVNGTANLLVNDALVVGRKAGVGSGNGTLNVNGLGAQVRVNAPITDAGGISTIAVTRGLLKARGIGTPAAPISTLSVDNATLVVDLGSTGLPAPASPWAAVDVFTRGTSVKIGLDYTRGLAPGTFTAIDAAVLNGTGTVQLAPKMPARVAATLALNGTHYDITVSAADQPKWDGAFNGDWDIDTSAAGTGGTANWNLANAGTPTTYREDLVTYATTDKVLFDDSATGTTTVNLTATLAPDRITVDNSAKNYTFAGPGKITGNARLLKQGTGTLTIANTGGNDFAGGIELQAGTLALGASEVIPNATTLTVRAGATLDVTTATETINNVTLAGGVITGSTGTLVTGVAAQSGTITARLTGASSVKKTTPGMLTLSGDNAYAGPTQVVAGTLVFAGSSNLIGPLNVRAGATVAVSPGGSKLLSVARAAVAGKLDLHDNTLIDRSGNLGSWSGSAYTGTLGLVDAGRGPAGAWTGPTGILSSEAAASSGATALGVATAAQVGRSTFAGVPVNPSDLLILYTYAGDATLDGRVNGDDYFQIDSHVGAAAATANWFNGDFNYDGKINGDDYFYIDSNANNPLGTFPTTGGTGDANALAASVPEPASLMPLLVLAAPLLARRRHRILSSALTLSPQPNTLHS
jgi:autotransporter-associated beta strand protein